MRERPTVMSSARPTSMILADAYAIAWGPVKMLPGPWEDVFNKPELTDGVTLWGRKVEVTDDLPDGVWAMVGTMELRLSP